MSAASSPSHSTELQQRRSSATVHADNDAGEQRSDGDENFIKQPIPRHAPTRHWSSLQEHAESVTAVTETPATGASTPRPEERREGFTWDSATAQEPGQPYPPHLPTPPSPPPLEEILRIRAEEEPKHGGNDNLTRSDTLTSRPSSKRFSVSSSFSYAPSRSDTSRSSISGVARGIMRHVPDIKMFTSADRVSEKSEEEGTQVHKAESSAKRASRKLSFLMPSSSATLDAKDRSSKPGTVANGSSSESTQPQKGGLKDRRNLGQAEALKLTLPLELPELPSRSRDRIYEPGNISRPRNRSPKTPWIRNEPLDFQPYTTSGPSTTPLGHGLLGSSPLQSSHSPRYERSPPKIRDRCYISRPKHRRERSGTGTSNSLLSRTPDGDFAPIPEGQFGHIPSDRQMKVTSDSNQMSSRPHRTRRWRWNGPWTSNDLNASDSPNQEVHERRFSIAQIFKPKRSDRLGISTNPDKKSERSYWRDKQSIPIRPPLTTDILAHMPVPLNFVPPGLNRVPTPPLYDSNGELKGKLADFFFDVQGGKAKKVKASPGGIWDSDALLMSQLTDITPTNSDSDEGPQGPASFASTPFEPQSAQKAPTPATTQQTGYLAVRPTPLSKSATAKDQWFRVQMDEKQDPIIKEAQERAKFEWLIPEHLPNSPLCPLHPIYRGPAKGVCLWHSSDSGANNGAARHSAGAALGRMTEVWEAEEMVDSPMSDKADVAGSHRRRRLVSLSSP